MNIANENERPQNQGDWRGKLDEQRIKNIEHEGKNEQTASTLQAVDNHALAVMTPSTDGIRAGGKQVLVEAQSQ